MTPAQRLKAASDALGRKKLAKVLEVDRKTIWRWIHGESRMDADALDWLLRNGF